MYVCTDLAVLLAVPVSCLVTHLRGTLVLPAFSIGGSYRAFAVGVEVGEEVAKAVTVAATVEHHAVEGLTATAAKSAGGLLFEERLVSLRNSRQQENRE